MAVLTGVAGTPTPDVVSVQGINSGIAVAVSAASLPLPTDAATSAKQDTGNASLSSIDSKLSSGVVCTLPAVPTGGATAFLRTSQNSINAVSVRGQACTLYSVNVTNRHASNYCYFKIYNKSSAPSPSGGVDFPTQVLCVPPGRKESLDLGVCGLVLTNGLAYCITGGYADNDETAVALGDVLVSGSYK